MTWRGYTTGRLDTGRGIKTQKGVLKRRNLNVITKKKTSIGCQDDHKLICGVNWRMPCASHYQTKDVQASWEQNNICRNGTGILISCIICHSEITQCISTAIKFLHLAERKYCINWPSEDDKWQYWKSPPLLAWQHISCQWILFKLMTFSIRICIQVLAIWILLM